jgi:hypothetical protein
LLFFVVVNPIFFSGDILISILCGWG